MQPYIQELRDSLPQEKRATFDARYLQQEKTMFGGVLMAVFFGLVAGAHCHVKGYHWWILWLFVGFTLTFIPNIAVWIWDFLFAVRSSTYSEHNLAVATRICEELQGGKRPRPAVGKLVTCGGCGKQISFLAAACPGCGHPRTEEEIAAAKMNRVKEEIAEAKTLSVGD